MDARNNLANQEVFKMARAADPAGIRTVGIITKCDALQSGDEDGVRNVNLLCGCKTNSIRSLKLPRTV